MIDKIAFFQKLTKEQWSRSTEGINISATPRLVAATRLRKCEREAR